MNNLIYQVLWSEKTDKSTQSEGNFKYNEDCLIGLKNYKKQLITRKDFTIGKCSKKW